MNSAVGLYDAASRGRFARLGVASILAAPLFAPSRLRCSITSRKNAYIMRTKCTQKPVCEFFTSTHSTTYESDTQKCTHFSDIAMSLLARAAEMNISSTKMNTPGSGGRSFSPLLRSSASCKRSRQKTVKIGELADFADFDHAVPSTYTNAKSAYADFPVPQVCHYLSLRIRVGSCSFVVCSAFPLPAYSARCK
jgi:hypothetical protein